MDKKIIIILVIIASLFSSLTHLLFISYFRIHKITVISSDKQIFGLTDLKNLNYFLIDDKKIINSLQQKNKLYRDIKVQKKFPDKIIIIFNSRPAFAQIISANEILFIDDQGYPTKSYQNHINLHKIKIPNIIYNIDNPDWRLLKSIKLINFLNNYSLQFSDIEITDTSQITGIIDLDIRVFVALDKDPAQVAASLQTIISRFRIEGKNISSIDFRFDKPVVILKNE